jgi:hypothetical protein
MIHIRRRVPETGGVTLCYGRNREEMTVAVANSGEQNRRPGGAIGSGTRGELERRGRGLSRRGAETKWAGNKEELKRGGDCARTRSPRGFRWRRETT